MTEEKTITHIKCKCGMNNEIIFLFELEYDCGVDIECPACGTLFDRDTLVPLAKSVLKRIFKDKDKFKKHCNDDKLYANEMERYIKLYETL